MPAPNVSCTPCITSPLYDDHPGHLPHVHMDDLLIYSLQVGPNCFHPERQQEENLTMKTYMVTTQSSYHKIKKRFKHFLNIFLKSDMSVLYFFEKN
jgi:hypothetical protein